MRKLILMAIAGYLWRKFMAGRATAAVNGPAPNLPSDSRHLRRR